MADENIQSTKTKIEQTIREFNPVADLAPGGVISELVIKPAAAAQNPIRNEVLAVSQASSIAAALNAEEDTYSEVVDGIASSYNIYRKGGIKSRGKILVSLASNASFTLRAGTTFKQPVLQLEYVVKEDLVVTSSGDPTLRLNAGLWQFVAEVEAVEVGREYQVSDKTTFTVEGSYTLPSFVSAVAYGNFTSGEDTETDKELISRFHEGLSNKTLLTEKSISSRLQELFPTYRQVSVVGAGAEELTRDKHNALGIASLGMADVYVRTTVGPETLQITKQAVALGNNRWRVEIVGEDAPGFYQVMKVLPAGNVAEGTLIHTTKFNFSTLGVYPSNNIYTPAEGRFTKYQTCTLDVEYETTETDVTFDITVLYQPYIKDIQDLFLSNSERIACADYLVKSIIPCFVTIELEVVRSGKEPDNLVSLLKKDIFDYVNSIAIGDTLDASEIIDICHNYRIKRVNLPIKMEGTILAPTNTNIVVSSNNRLVIPKDNNNGVSPNNTSFFIDYFGSPSGQTENISIKLS